MDSARFRQVLSGLGLVLACATVLMPQASKACSCTDGVRPMEWDSGPVHICACVHKPGLASQAVSWGVTNSSNDTLEIEFTKKYELKNGRTIRKNAHLYGVKAGKTVTGGNFSGDMDLNDSFFKEDCPGDDKVQSVGFEGLHYKGSR